MSREITSVSSEGSDYYRPKDLISNSERPLLAFTAAIAYVPVALPRPQCTPS
jgi:hypothetical protein